VFGILCTKHQVILKLKYVIRFSVCRFGASTLFKATHRHNDRPKIKDPIKITLYTKGPTHTMTN